MKINKILYSLIFGLIFLEISSSIENKLDEIEMEKIIKESLKQEYLYYFNQAEKNFINSDYQKILIHEFSHYIGYSKICKENFVLTIHSRGGRFHMDKS